MYFINIKKLLIIRNIVIIMTTIRAVFLMGGHNLTENGFLLMKEDSSIQSPVTVLYYEFYENIENVKDYIDENLDLLQCVVCKINIIKKSTYFGETQKPNLWDYALTI